MSRLPEGSGLIALDGFVGATLRYGVDVLAGDVTGVGTFVVNVIGSFALGVLVTQAADRQTQLFVGTGLLSSFTTYSTFASDVVVLGTTMGSVYIAASYGVGLAAAAAGLAVGRRL
ncbi:fluoride efflux transporter FluC [Halorubrum vacuolatum]|uniref:Fluoride-specific ion channel FluC n=1 Tax=Halorubrum vacuolatum TaxID=63740 RepID=A0A238YFZ3_HALVU|nr:CrcB family protein [Halorubrum vacuolatum]SNR69651.1 camphor resistance protein CrcB [Halorubrum vacuolatum]